MNSSILVLLYLLREILNKSFEEEKKNLLWDKYHHQRPICSSGNIRIEDDMYHLLLLLYVNQIKLVQYSCLRDRA